MFRIAATHCLSGGYATMEGAVIADFGTAVQVRRQGARYSQRPERVRLRSAAVLAGGSGIHEAGLREQSGESSRF